MKTKISFLSFEILLAGCNGSGTVNNTASTTADTNSITSNQVTTTATTEYAYIIDRVNNKILMAKVNANTAELSPYSFANVATGIKPWSISLSPNKLFAYVVNAGSNSISIYLINTNGTINLIATTLTDNEPHHIVFSPNGKFAYVSSYLGNETYSIIDVYNVNASNGNLIQTSSYQTDTSSVDHLLVDPTGKYLYIGAADHNSTGLKSYSINQSNGELTFANNIAGGGSNNQSMVLSPNNEYMYSTFESVPTSGNNANKIIAGINNYILENGLPICSGDNIDSYCSTIITAPIDYAPKDFRICNGDSATSFAYQLNQSVIGLNSTINIYAINEDSSLQQVNTLNLASAVNTMQINNSGQYLYTLDVNGRYSLYSINSADGNLTSIKSSAAFGSTNSDLKDMMFVFAPDKRACSGTGVSSCSSITNKTQCNNSFLETGNRNQDMQCGWTGTSCSNSGGYCNN